MAREKDPDFTKELGTRMKVIQENGVLTIARLCRMLEITRQFWHLISKGERVPNLPTLIGFCKIYGITIDELVKDIPIVIGYGRYEENQRKMIEIIKKQEGEF